VRAAAEAIRDRIPASDCRFQTDVAENLPAVRADEDALTTALLNLLDNAIKYTPGEKRITLRAFQRGARVVFEVEDNGVGVPPRERGKIFRRFYQIDRSLARAGSGCGLGLSIVDYIVRAHGGAISVAGESGKGSVFSISIPLHSAKEAAA
jgi:signal transduction histidine kinase